MSILDEREDYKHNEYFREEDRIKGDFTPFYVAISICTVIGGLLLIINVAFCFCSQYKGYWRSRHTGNRWIQSLWTVTPHDNPPLDLSELEPAAAKKRKEFAVLQEEEVAQYHDEDVEQGSHHQQQQYQSQQYIELQKRESDI